MDWIGILVLVCQLIMIPPQGDELEYIHFFWGHVPVDREVASIGGVGP